MRAADARTVGPTIRISQPLVTSFILRSRPAYRAPTASGHGRDSEKEDYGTWPVSSRPCNSGFYSLPPKRHSRRGANALPIRIKK